MFNLRFLRITKLFIPSISHLWIFLQNLIGDQLFLLEPWEIGQSEGIEINMHNIYNGSGERNQIIRY